MVSDYQERVPDYGQVMTVDEFRRAVQAGAYVDHDGHGHPARDGKMNNEMTVMPSKTHLIPGDATHVVWFNR